VPRITQTGCGFSSRSRTRHVRDMIDVNFRMAALVSEAEPYHRNLRKPAVRTLSSSDSSVCITRVTRLLSMVHLGPMSCSLFPNSLSGRQGEAVD